MRCESMSSTVAQCPVALTHRCQLTIKTVSHVCQPYVVKTGYFLAPLVFLPLRHAVPRNSLL
jgi:hypothetical protein